MTRTGVLPLEGPLDGTNCVTFLGASNVNWRASCAKLCPFNVTCRGTETARLGDDGERAGGKGGVLQMTASIEDHIAGTVYSSLPKRQWMSPKPLPGVEVDDDLGAKFSPKTVTIVPPSAVPEIGEERTARD